MILKTASSYINENLLNGDDYAAYLDVTDDKKYGGAFVDYKLSLKNCGGDKCLVINGGATAAAKNLTNQIAVDLEAITRIIDGLDNEQAKKSPTRTKKLNLKNFNKKLCKTVAKSMMKNTLI